ncbi:hypothetical protein DFS34DRAFT_687608 [Phlyctochytrium arcticum]|nr:hypothetical protein DFS34DRAFT_597843 [Phlyctochytrium arcticum]KAI9094146.1 hypothetical protein DFS34DRAFT_687608 [Phlyctochytrium arcticum]
MIVDPSVYIAIISKYERYTTVGNTEVTENYKRLIKETFKIDLPIRTRAEQIKPVIAKLKDDLKTGMNDSWESFDFSLNEDDLKEEIRQVFNSLRWVDWSRASLFFLRFKDLNLFTCEEVRMIVELRALEHIVSEVEQPPEYSK